MSDPSVTRYPEAVGLVLVVDDEADIRDLIRLNLEAAGHRVATAHDGEAALAAVRQERPDVIVLDVLMPGLDGWHVLERLKGCGEGFDDIPVVMVTALGQTEDRLRAGIEGAVRFITKPFEPAELLDAVGESLAPDAPPEAVVRRRVRHEAMEALARIEGRGGDANPSDEPRVRLTRLERISHSPPVPAEIRDAREGLTSLTRKQRELLEAIALGDGVSAAADALGTSRSNVYASLRRIVRRLRLRSTSQLLHLLRDGLLAEGLPAGGPDPDAPDPSA